jgi:hypothetical protein
MKPEEPIRDRRTGIHARGQSMSVNASQQARELCGQLVQHLDGLLGHTSGIDLSAFALTQIQKVAIVGLARTHDLTDSIRALIEAGYVEQAGTLLRSLFELHVSLAYIQAADTERRAQRFLDYDDVLAHRGLQRLRRLGERGVRGARKALSAQPARVREIERTYRQFEKRYSKEKGSWNGSHWSGLNVYQLCRSLNRVTEYVTVYQRYSEPTHSSARSLAKQLQQTDCKTDGILLQWGKDSAGVLDVLCYACAYGIELALLCARAFSAPAKATAPFGALSCRHARIFLSVLRDNQVAN